MPRRHTFRTWDDYFIPGTSVLRNKFTSPGKPHGETDPDALRVREEGAALLRLTELSVRPLEGGFDYDHMKAIHRHVFQDVYEWAGEERVAPVGQFMNKEGHAYYPAGPSLTEAAHTQYARISDQDFLRGLEHGPFVDELAEHWGELNVIHSFREGNTRTQFVFFSELAEEAGYRLDSSQFAVGAPLRDEFVQARFHSQDTGSNERLAGVLRRAIAPLDAAAEQTDSGADLSAAVRKAREAAGYLTTGDRPAGSSTQPRADQPRTDRSRAQSQGYER